MSKWRANMILPAVATALLVYNASLSPHYLPKFAGDGSLVNSIVYESGNAVGIGTTSPYANASLDLANGLAAAGQRVLYQGGGVLSLGDIDQGDGPITASRSIDQEPSLGKRSSHGVRDAARSSCC